MPLAGRKAIRPNLFAGVTGRRCRPWLARKLRVTAVAALLRDALALGKGITGACRGMRNIDHKHFQ
jgi:gamma-glutamyl-gamma-aminobutyrate hydrolase PuuD